MGKSYEELFDENNNLKSYLDDMNNNFDEIIEYEVSKRSGIGYWSEDSEIGILNNQIECFKREMKSFENYLTEKNCWYLYKDWKDIYEKFGRMVDFGDGMLEKYERNLRTYRLDRSKGD